MVAHILAADTSAGVEPTTTSTTTTTTTSSTTSSSLLAEYQNHILLGIFPAKPIASLTLRIRAYPDYGPDDADCMSFGPGDFTGPFSGLAELTFGSLEDGELDRSQAAIRCGYYTHEPHGPLWPGDFGVSNFVATDADGKAVDVELCILGFDEDYLAIPGPNECRWACGDALCDGGEPRATDSLAVLRRAIGTYECDERVCDVNHDGQITSADALKVLRRSVSLRSHLLCPC